MRNTEKVRRSAAPNLLVQFPLAELTLQLAVDPNKSRQSIPARADGRSQQKPMVDPSKSRRQEPMVDPDIGAGGTEVGEGVGSGVVDAREGTVGRDGTAGDGEEALRQRRW
jgi:hypothetical protein